ALCDKERIKKSLRERELQLLNANFPDDHQVIDSLLEVNLYKQRNNLAKFALLTIEKSFTKETIDFDDAQVEHIMPQRLNNDWRLQIVGADKINKQYGGTIGNLTLTKYNQEISNKNFNEKRDFYNTSNILITREISQYEQWGKDEIINRTKQLAKRLIDIFPKPNIQKETADEILGEH
ncbi:HNH endonuclease, partial [Lactobacillus sp. XV13L]|nr:HNH endonuclease [Lactobacillus sp. XV13L]